LNIAYCFINLAGVYLNRCEIETALDYFNRALIIQKEYLPPNHLDIALCLKNIAGCYQKSLNTNELNKVHDYLKEAIKIESKKALHFKHNLDLAISYNNMASVYYHKKEFAKALEYNEKSFRMNNGLSTPEVGHFLNNTGLVYKTQYKYDQAFDLYSKALKHWQSVLPINHPNGAVVSNNIGCAFASVAAQDQNDEQANKKALEYLESALAISKETLQFDHTNIAITYYNIVQVYELILTKKKSKLKLT
jgi:tetratricopeptide (TPR) repeat protein